MAMRIEGNQKTIAMKYEEKKPRNVRHVQGRSQNEPKAHSDGPADRPAENKDYRHFSANAREGRGRYQQQRAKYNDKQKKSENVEDDSQLGNRMERMEMQMLQLSNQIQGLAAAQLKVQQPQPPPLPLPKIDTFPIPTTQVNQQQPSQTAASYRGGSVCYNCQQPGHYIRNCPYRQQSQAPQQRNGSDTSGAYKSHAMQRDTWQSGGGQTSDFRNNYHEPEKVYLNIRLQGSNRQCLLDSGCDITVIPAKFVQRDRIVETTRTLLAANGTSIPILGSVTLKATVGRQMIEIRGLVTHHVTDIMLGVDWLRTYGV